MPVKSCKAEWGHRILMNGYVVDVARIGKKWVVHGPARTALRANSFESAQKQVLRPISMEFDTLTEACFHAGWLVRNSQEKVEK